MITTFQFKNQSVLEHGISVHKHYKALCKALDNNDTSFYKIPPLLAENWNRIKPLLFSAKIMKQYHVYHDCGKPFCIKIDDDGRRHFENHADISFVIYREVFADKQSVVPELILNDMMFHSGKMEEIDKFIMKHDLSFLFSLWMTSLSEINSNKLMFDESNQLSFKIKLDKLERVLKKLIKLLNESKGNLMEG